MGSFQHSKRSEALYCGNKMKNFYWEFDLILLSLEAVVNIPIQTLIILPWLLFRKMIISQLELGPPVVKPNVSHVWN